MSIHIGNQTSFAAPSINIPFRFAIDNGFSAFEWFPDKKDDGSGWEIEDISTDQRDSFRNSAFKNNLRISVHVPWNANPLQPDAGRIISEHICFAKDMGASLINIHLYTDSGIDAFIESIIPYFDDLAQNRISLAIENTPLTTPDNFNELFEKILKSGHPALSNAGMCLDIGHANLCSPTINDYIRYLDLLEPHVPINHVHLHENYGDCDSHLCLFTGPSAQNTDGISLLIRRLHGRHFNGSLILEQWPEHPALLKQAVTRLRRMLGSVRKPKTRAEKLPIKDFAQQLSSADSRYHSWREKLCWIEKRLHNRKQPVNRDMLIYLAVYMRFIGTGALSCREDGGHYRPCHHTRLSKSIFDRLLELNNNDNSFIIRKIFPWLPSFDAAFSCAEPLTRIRDIAHRNDVPQDLKREIKHSLQNKLHRCAGPEDLDTSAALLARITAPGTDYSVEFINEFQKFHAELKEFFNACTLEEDLETLTKHPCFSSGQDVTIVSDCIRSFCAFSRTEDTVSNISRHLTCLTELRTHLKKMESLQDLNQSITVIDCKLEDVAFMLAGKLLRLDAFSSAKPSLSESLTGIILIVRNLQLSGFNHAECSALCGELRSYTQIDRDDDSLILLKVHAALERCRRLADQFCTLVLELFPQRVKRLGALLNIAPHTLTVYCESEIRKHLIFHLSNSADALLSSIRNYIPYSRLDIIIPGKASGIVAYGADLASVSGNPDSPTIAIIDHLTGDEDLPENISALICRKDTCHLSHFAVRARQAKIPFAVCRDQQKYDRLKSICGTSVTISICNENLSHQPVIKSENLQQPKNNIPAPQPVRAEPVNTITTINITDAQPGSCGSKAFAASRLAVIAQKHKNLFMTPGSLALPFGILQLLLKNDAQAFKLYKELIASVPLNSSTEFKNHLNGIQACISAVTLPKILIESIQKNFGTAVRLMVRSSSNCEDLPAFSGAGLYCSKTNVQPEAVAEAIKAVWSSLWDPEAVRSRETTGIKHSDAMMAVLIQEMITPDVSFFMHTVNPADNDHNTIVTELAPGLGDTLANATSQGTPYRAVYDKRTKKGTLRCFANYSYALMPDPAGGLTQTSIDYRRVALSSDQTYSADILNRLGQIGSCIEASFNCPQDIEGCIREKEIFIVQARPQQGVDQ